MTEYIVRGVMKKSIYQTTLNIHDGPDQRTSCRLDV